MSELVLRNRQRVRRVNTTLLRRLTHSLLEITLGIEDYELGVHLVTECEMSRVNKKFLNHEGSTDVITFDYTEGNSGMRGEIFVCLNDAVTQARQFGTSWQLEVVRYVIHGVLHLQGHDDLHTSERRKMKREEGRLLKETARHFALSKLAARPRLAP